MKKIRSIKKIPITREGYDKLKIDLTELKRSRPEAVNTLSDARKMGDLSENGLYTAAKMRLKSIDAQIFRLNIQIKLADIVEDSSGDIVSINSKVLITNGNKKRELHIVGHYEADPLNDKISSKSPIGRALIGKKVGDEVEFRAPKGKLMYKIIKII